MKSASRKWCFFHGVLKGIEQPDWAKAREAGSWVEPAGENLWLDSPWHERAGPSKGEGGRIQQARNCNSIPHDTIQIHLRRIFCK